MNELINGRFFRLKSCHHKEIRIYRESLSSSITPRELGGSSFELTDKLKSTICIPWLSFVAKRSIQEAADELDPKNHAIKKTQTRMP